MRAVCWNMRSAKADRSAAWEYLLELNPDIALLQDVVSLPLQVATAYDTRGAFAIKKNGQSQRFKTMLLVRGRIHEEIVLPSVQPWIAKEYQRHAGNLLSYRVQLDAGPKLHAISVYNPAWPLNQDRLPDIDTGEIRLTQQKRHIWLADLLWSSLGLLLGQSPYPFIIAGDFNLCETFDQWGNAPRGNREYLDRMAHLGLIECLRHTSGRIVPTFRKPGAEAPNCQIDHMFVSPSLVGSGFAATAGSPEIVFGQSLSDHLPIIADFVVP